MAIVKRISNDNVITSMAELAAHELQAKADDDRGIFDPKKDPVKGSWIGEFGEDNDQRASVLRRYGYLASMEEEVPYPNEMRVQDLLAQVRSSSSGDRIEQQYRNRITSPLSAIRAWCVTQCQSGAIQAVGNCRKMECPLWAFRMGQNGMRGKQ